MASDQRTLQEFAETYRRPPTMWAESELPDDVKDQILAMPHIGARKVVQWLREIGYEEATESKIEHFRRRRT